MTEITILKKATTMKHLHISQVAHVLMMRKNGGKALLLRLPLTRIIFAALLLPDIFRRRAALTASDLKVTRDGQVIMSPWKALKYRLIL